MFQAATTPFMEMAAPVLSDQDVNVDHLLAAVTGLDANASDAVLIDRIAALERLKSGCAAAQARLTATFAAAQTADGAARRQEPDRVRRSIAGQVALARRDSPVAGRRHVGVASALVADLPHTLAALTRGELSERRARIVVEQLACLTPAGRREADALLAPELPGLGDRSAETRAAAVAYALDPEAVMAKVRGAVKDRHVSIRPAPDVMARLSALLPVAAAVAVYAALSKAADTATAASGGDPRTRGQLMADALVSAVTGHTVVGCDPYGAPQYAGPQNAPASQNAPRPAHGETASPADGTDCAATGSRATAGPDADAETVDSEPSRTSGEASHGNEEGGAANDADSTAVEPEVSSTAAKPGTAVASAGCAGGCGIGINLIMTDRTLLDGDDEPAHLHGHGPIPAALARALVIGAADTTTRTWIRRLYTDPVSGNLTAMDSKRRLFPAAAQRFLLARDQTCRTPWCDAPIRQADHVRPHADGGSTSIDNGQGLCQACNLTKQAPRWFAGTTSDGAIHLTVPTGHTYRSTAPPPPRSKPWADISFTEHRFAKALLWSADRGPDQPFPRAS